MKYWNSSAGEWQPVAPGPKGDKGDKGDTGDLANLHIGTVETGEEAAAELDGNFENGYTLDLTLPRAPIPEFSIGTVTTGTADATITGTDEEPVLSLVLPSAGANGVNTAAIQDSAVTEAKTSYLSPSSNLWNPATELELTQINGGTGALEVSGAYNTTALIPVAASTAYTFYRAFAVAYYSATLTYRGIDGADPQSETGTTLTTPTNTAYVRVLYVPGGYGKDYTQRRVNLGSSLVDWEPYAHYLDETIRLGPLYADSLINPSDRFMFDVPVDQVFTTEETFADAPSWPVNTAAVHTLFDGLVSAYPDYISKTELGVDADDNPLNLYRCTPAQPIATEGQNEGVSIEARLPKVFLTAGIHGVEKSQTLMLYLLVKLMCEQWDDHPALEPLRFNVDLMFIPVTNPSGWDAGTYTNSNGVNLMLNFSEGWTAGGTGNSYPGTAPFSEPEVQCVRDVFTAHPDIDVYYDCHNFGGALNTDFLWIPTAAGRYHQHMAQSFIGRMSRVWRRRHTGIASSWIAGYTNTETNGGMPNQYATSVGVRYASIYEINDAARVLGGGETSYATNHKMWGVEAMANWLLINLRELEKNQIRATA
jgi:hypothetical protein